MKTKAEKILEAIEEAMKPVDKLWAELRRHQGKCKHRKATFEYKVDCFGHRRSKRWSCPTCKKNWNTDLINRPIWNE